MRMIQSLCAKPPGPRKPCVCRTAVLGGKMEKPAKAPKEKSKPELSAAAAEAVREAAASGLPEGWVEVTDEGTGRVFYGNVKTGERQLERPQ